MDVEIRGNNALRSTDIRELLGFTIVEPLTDVAVRRALDALAERYVAEGYWNATFRLRERTRASCWTSRKARGWSRSVVA